MEDPGQSKGGQWASLEKGKIAVKNLQQAFNGRGGDGDEEDPGQPTEGRQASFRQGEMNGKLRQAKILGGNGSDEDFSDEDANMTLPMQSICCLESEEWVTVSRPALAYGLAPPCMPLLLKISWRRKRHHAR